MSKTTKIKHVTKEVLEDFVLPGESQEIVKVVSSQGNNLHMVENTSGCTFLVSMPTKFRKRIWIKRGDFVIIQPIAEGDKVKAEIVNILYQDQIKYIRECKLWPQEFEYPGKGVNENRSLKHGKIEKCANSATNSTTPAVDSCDSECDSDCDDDDDLFVNPNHLNKPYYIQDDDDDSSGSSSSDEKNGESDDDDVIGGVKEIKLHEDDDNNNVNSSKLPSY